MKKSKPGCDLKTCMLCRLSQKEWIPAVATHRSNFKFNKGEMIFEEGKEVRGIYFVFEGVVKVHKHWGEDKELILRFAKQGDIIGHRGLGEDLIYPVSGTAIEPTTVCFLELDFFKSTLKTNYEFLFELMQFFASELKVSERNMRNLAHMTVKGRVAQALITMEEKFGCTPEGLINLSISRQDLASFVGSTYETVFRVLNELTEEGALITDKKGIKITDRPALKTHLK